jgi:internalin A
VACIVSDYLAPSSGFTPYDVATQRIQQARELGLMHLDLSGLNLTELPSEIGQLTDLQGLGLHDNQLTNLPPEIGQLTNLQYLTVANNQLTSLPPEIGQLAYLQTLNLSQNQLTSLPSEIAALNGLQWLILHSNQLQHLPPEMGNLTNLTCSECFLALYNNPLVSPPPEVVEQGTAAVLEYLRKQAWYHIQRLIVAGASGVGLLAILLLGFLWKQRQRKRKKKREMGM